MHKLLFYLFILNISLSSCVHLNPKFRTHKEFDGLDSTFVNDTVGDKIKRTVVFIVHGIGMQEQNYSYKMTNQLAKNLLGKNFKYEHAIPISIVDDAMEKTVLKSEDMSMELVVYSLKWTSFSEFYKDSLREMEFARKPFRWSIWKTIKNEIMIDKAGDLFFAQHSKVLPQIVSAVDSAFKDAANCKYKLTNVNLISGSLGTQVFLKYLSFKILGFNVITKPTPTLLNENPNWNVYLKEEDVKIMNSLFDSTSIELLRKSMNDTIYLNNTPNFSYNNLQIMIKLLPDSIMGATLKNHLSLKFYYADSIKNLNFYMLTNQYNLMKDNIKTWGGIDLNTKYRELQPKFDSINIVAFKNPNDMLSYEVPDDFLSEDGTTEITNVWYWNFIIRNNLLAAHTAPFKLKKMYNVIAFGSKKGDKKNKWVAVKKKYEKKVL